MSPGSPTLSHLQTTAWLPSIAKFFFFVHNDFFSPFSPNVEPGPRLHVVAVFPHCVSLDNSVDFFGINHMPARSCCFVHIIRFDPTEGSPTYLSQWACMSQFNPSSYAGGRFISWYGHPCQICRGVEA